MKKITLLVLSLIGSVSTSFGQLSENFDIWPPAGWTIQSTNTDQTWEGVDEFNGGIVGNGAQVLYDFGQDESLISPVFTVPAGAPNLKFKVALSYYWAVDPNDNYDATVSISTDGGGTWTQLWSENDLGVFNNWEPYDVSIPLTSYAGSTNAKIKFNYFGDDGAALYIDEVSVALPPTVAPDCVTQTAPTNAATGIDYTAAVTLTWTAATTGPAAESYDVFLDTNANPTTLLGNQTGLTRDVTGLLASTTYYWKVIAKNETGDATGCSVFSFTTMANPFAPYCGPINFVNNTEPITLVNFADINNVTSATLNGTPDHENFTSITGHIIAGNAYTITIKGNTDGDFTNRFMVFADWNQDGDFADTDEAYTITQTITNSNGTDATQATQSLQVPPTATVGNTRMRVKKIYGTDFYADPCVGTNYGQVEEYTLNVAAQPSDTPDYAGLQWPPTATIPVNSGSVTVYGRVYEPGVTPGAGAGAGIQAWVGVSPIGSNTNPNTWTSWIPATFNVDSGNDDEYMATIGAGLTPGTYYYATRFQLNGGPYVYGGIDSSNNGNFWNGTTHNSGVLTVSPPPPVEPNCDLTSDLPDDSLGGIVWTRPLADGSDLSAVGVDVSYHIYGPITVDTDGNYTFSSTQDFDGVIFVYENAFDPNDQLTNYLAGNDDGGPGSELSTDLATGTTYYFITTSFSPGDFGTFTTEITGPGEVTCGELAVPGFNENNFAYYPNPVKNNLNLSYNKEISNVEVFNLLGQKVSSNVINANNAQIDMSNLSKGAYIVKITSDNQVKAIKVIKQ